MALPVRTWLMSALRVGNYDGTIHGRLWRLEDFVDNYLTHWEVSAADGAYSTETLTLTGQPLDTETVTIGGRVYTFETSFSDTANYVLVGATASDSLDNLIAAITNGAGEGSTYGTGTGVHANVTAAAGAGDTMDVTAKVKGTAGDSITLAEGLTNGLWDGGATNLSGGADMEWLEIKPAAGAPASIENYRLFICGTPADDSNPSLPLYPNTNTENTHQLYVTYAPDVGGTYPNGGATDQWKTGSPWASATPVVNDRWPNGFQRWMGPGYGADFFWAIECEDMLMISGTEDNSGDQYPFICGACVEAPSVELGDEIRGDEALYALFCVGHYRFGGNGEIAWYSVNDNAYEDYFLSAASMSTSANRQYKQGTNRILVSYGDSTTWNVGRMYNTEDQDPPTATVAQLIEARCRLRNNKIQCDPVELKGRDTWLRHGKLRQMYPFPYALAHTTIEDVSGSVVGHVLAAQLTHASGDGLLFSNTTSPYV